ncbi:insulinase family protein [Roseospira marina]|uniref:Insulinase family protein n=1 Tax=Roseospira marina TaxID=140057 RepID=A0A5M6IBD7_9PROT|nr:pitrilysin family protein [Roseospira marina]KAA5605039.1 insulinase family protein [Roseospira marina]MBB4314950.1 putative Zn-dependent peptidase [Roseospira marina]MBB5087950.1 putative Zn-dependent peptidase [Roseospira marina]
MPTTAIRETRLPSGLRVLTDPMDTVETVSVGVWADVGARHEPAPLNGVCHMLEHMAFKGTRRRSALDIAVEMEDVGGNMNAYTSREHTAFYAKMLKDDLPLAVDILADILQHSVFDPEELAREQGVVVQEIAQSIDTPDDIVFDHFQATAYGDQPLGRPVLGTVETVEGLNSDTIGGFQHTHYSPDRLVVAAAGRVDHDALVDLVGRQFTALNPRPAKGDLHAHYTGGEYRESRDVEQTQVVLGFEGVAYDDPDYYATVMLATLLGGGMSSRLFQEVREKRGLAYTVNAFASSYIDGGLFTLYAGTGPEDVAALTPVLCEEIGKVRTRVAADEVARARAQLRAGILMGQESTTGRCEQLARQILVYGRPISNEEVLAELNTIDEAAIVRVANRVFSTAPTLAALGSIDGMVSLERLKGWI